MKIETSSTALIETCFELEIQLPTISFTNVDMNISFTDLSVLQSIQRLCF